MEIEELLVSMGIDANQAAKLKDVVIALSTAAASIAAQMNRVRDNLDDVSQNFSLLKSLATGVGSSIDFVFSKVMGFINEAAAGARSLAQEKGLLFAISAQELQQASQYQAASKKTALSIESIKTKLALGLMPELTKTINSFNDWLFANKALISEGLTQVIKWGSKIIQVIANSGKAIDLFVERTVGWKVAIGGIIAILAIFKKSMILAFIANPVTWVMAAVVGLMLLLDDLMVYLRGGESLFGGFWGSAIEGVKSAIAWWNAFYTQNKAVFEGIAYVWSLAFESFLTTFGGFFTFITNAFKMLVGLFTGDTQLMSQAWQGMVDGILQILDGLEQALITFFAAFALLWKVLSQVVDNVWQVIKTAVISAFNGLLNTAKSFINQLIDVFFNITAYILMPFKSAFSLIKSLYDFFADDSTSWTDKLFLIFSNIANFIFSPFIAAFDYIKSLYAIFTDDSTSWVEKLSLVFTNIMDYFLAPFEAGWEGVKKLFSLSDSDVSNFIDGIGSTFTDVIDLIKAPFKIAFDWVDEKFGSIVSSMTKVLTKLGILKEENQGLETLLATSSLVGSLIQHPGNPNLSNVSNSNKSMVLNQGDVNVTQSIVTQDSQQAATMALEGINKNLTTIMYKNLASSVQP